MRVSRARAGLQCSILLLLTWAGSACAALAVPMADPQPATSLQAWASGLEPLATADGGLAYRQTLQEFYLRPDQQPIWIADDTITPGAELLLATLRGSERDGLEPADYHLAAIERRLQGEHGTAQSRIELELLLSDALLRYAHDVSIGRLHPRTADPEWFISPPELDRLALLERVVSSLDGIEDVLADLPPPHREYVRLREALAHYRHLAQQGNWPIVGSGPKLEEGARDRRVEQLRRRLRVTGELAHQPAADEQLFDPELEQAIMRFQERHGLLVDGVVGPHTVRSLNVSAAERVRQLVTNMERWRWVPRDMGRRHITVNMAGFELEVIEDGEKVMDMRVIVGKPYRRTPSFTSGITQMVLNPFWYIPRRIAIEDILPKIRKNPAYLKQHNIKVFLKQSGQTQAVAGEELMLATDGYFPYRLRQAPGPRNPLGRVKFLLPNQFDVYLHDTTKPELFQKPVRMFSSGCIRLEKPFELAAYLLRDSPQWTPERIATVVKGKATKTVRLSEPMPIYLVYVTAWVDDSGIAQFRDDIYSRDKRMQEALKASRSPRGDAPGAVYNHMAARSPL